jgi:hypothetical protein
VDVDALYPAVADWLRWQWQRKQRDRGNLEAWMRVCRVSHREGPQGRTVGRTGRIQPIYSAWASGGPHIGAGRPRGSAGARRRLADAGPTPTTTRSLLHAPNAPAGASVVSTAVWWRQTPQIR